MSHAVVPPPSAVERRPITQLVLAIFLFVLMLLGFGWLFLHRGKPPWIQGLIGVPSVIFGCCAVVVFEWHQKTSKARMALAGGTVLAMLGTFFSILQLPAPSIEADAGTGVSSSPPAALSPTPNASPPKSTEPTPSASTQETPTPSQSPASESKPALIVEQVGWPMFPDCDAGAQVAALKGQPDASDYNGDSNAQDVRARIIKAGGASWENGTVTLSLSARKGTKVNVVGIDVVTFSHSKLKAAWVWAPYGGGCGGTQAKRYGVNFDAAHPSVFEIPHAGDSGPRRFGDPFSVTSKGRPIPVEVWSGNCKQYVEWGLRINFTVSGEDGIQTLDINSSDHPYRSIGGQPPAYVNLGDAYTNKMTRDTGSDRPCDARVNSWKQE